VMRFGGTQYRPVWRLVQWTANPLSLENQSPDKFLL
jgi:hypothetical protein